MSKRWWVLGLGAAGLVALLAPLASLHPDGLERVAEDHGFAGRALEPAYRLIPDYAFPGVSDGRLATVLASLLGVLLLFALMWGVARLLARRRAP